MAAVDGALRLWFGLTVPAVLFTAWDVLKRTPAMTVMKWGWILVVLYTGPIGAFVYVLSCREPLAGTHADYVAPLWKQAVGSTIHCVAGDATGIIFGALVALALRLPRAGDLILEYAAGFAFGLFIFQALFSKIMTGGSYGQAVRRTVLPEWLSMNFLMAAMIPTMAMLMANPSTMDPTGLRFWGAMSTAILVGAVAAYPVNVWLVARGLKHGMGTAQVLGRGGHGVEREPAEMASHTGRSTSRSTRGTRPRAGEMLLVTAASLASLAAGVFAVARLGWLK